ncbi:hypothetical protein NPX13_g2090 [Xylaria arbuscula]|uniref:Heterokaryon incompatibility domain-containing protein n=1 Tax=Xylaria arbuscula TaxID=114810 RepID=A0A9W8NJV1_9PEZI|nr:hypothetical protein NPX13_g2090 [Xylaria arbuscula]
MLDRSDPQGLIFSIQIQTCKHTVRLGTQDACGYHGSCQGIGLGALLPINPGHREEDVVFETTLDESRSTRDKKTRYCAYARPVGPRIDIGLVQKWVARCTDSHGQCRDTGASEPMSPAIIRLIDVKHKRVVLHDRSCRYIALSYVWGRNTKGLLTRSTVNKYTLAGSLEQEDIPLTIRDAIALVADLNERYLWADSLCIIQDDVADKRKYLPMMGDIFSAATMVIVAAVENAHSGLPGRGSSERRQRRPVEKIQGIEFTIGAPDPQDHLATTTWDRRGWTYQEAQLARRILIIAETQVYWSCREEFWCEDRFSEFLIPAKSPFIPSSLSPIQVSPLRSRSLFIPRTEPCVLGEYVRRVNEFSYRSFSDRQDRLWAFLGILKSLIPLFPEGFIWAIPRAELDAAILWKADSASHFPAPLAILNPKGQWQESNFPSWSWMCKGTEIWYDDCYESVVSMVDWGQPVNMDEHRPLNNGGRKTRENDIANDTQSAIFQPDHVSSTSTIFDYALLQLTAESAILRVHTPQARSTQVEIYYDSLVTATISLNSGKDIGSIDLPLGAFCDGNIVTTHEIEGEFVLLSSVASKSGDGTEMSEPRYNIMLLSWSDDKKIAYRVSWTNIARSAWEECETQRKTIILG